MPGPRLLAALCGVLLCASGLFAASGDFCDSSQCLNGGTCLLDQDNLLFYCLCPEGFTGLICNETEKAGIPTTRGWTSRASSMPGLLRATLPLSGCRLTWATRGE
ncbi:milk fat globule EGF and factor V/VIII domain containing [Rhinolophus ferrumequinum]|uniref:Milk fat globule EGF and factor V/VIII domain containing n=1 Tax=Rhinolophus ferrumequinum TaxID=59479 RepID=A0A7J7RAW5_RHIFE|nr:milk fat globule EGF and factor V/VIII domain containing [Rhinolophus ferrumequinum]